jgi:hypothetical protein
MYKSDISGLEILNCKTHIILEIFIPILKFIYWQYPLNAFSHQIPECLVNFSFTIANYLGTNWFY